MNTTENPCILDRAWLPTWKYQVGITFLWCVAYAVLLAFTDTFHAEREMICFFALLLTYSIFITGFVAPAGQNAGRETLTFLGFLALMLGVSWVMDYFENDWGTFLLWSLLVPFGIWTSLTWSACRSFWALPPENHVIRRTFFISTVGMLTACGITCCIDSFWSLLPILFFVSFWLSFGFLLFMVRIAIRAERKRSAPKNETEDRVADETENENVTETAPSIVSWRARACVAGCLGTLFYYGLYGLFWGFILLVPHMIDSRESVQQHFKDVDMHVPKTATWEKAIQAGFLECYDCALLTMTAEDFARIQLPEGVAWEKPTDMEEVNLIYNDRFWTPAFTEEELKQNFEAGHVWFFSMPPNYAGPGGVACFDEKGENVRVWLCYRGK